MKCTECSSQVRPVVVVDIDGTLADYHSAFSLFVAQYFNKKVPFPMSWDGSGEFEEYLGITKPEYREAKLAYRQGGSKRWLPVFTGAKEMLREINNRGAEVWVATTRPWQRLDNIDPDTREWLRRNDFDVHGLLFGEDKYRQLCQAVDRSRIIAAIEDLPEQFDIARNLGLPVFQVERVHNSAPACERTPRGTLSQVANWVYERLEEWEEKNDYDRAR